MAPIIEWSFWDWWTFFVVVWLFTGAIWLLVTGLENRRMRLEKEGGKHD